MVASVSLSHILSLPYLDPHPVVCVLALCAPIFGNLTYSFLRMILTLHINRASLLHQTFLIPLAIAACLFHPYIKCTTTDPMLYTKWLLSIFQISSYL